MKKGMMTFPSADGRTTIFATIWEPDEEPKAILQIIHGMAEYIERYDAFASFLTEKGYMVAGTDLLGHGRSVVNETEDLGYFGPDGNAVVISDINSLRQSLQNKHPGVPYFMMGHSMGSFLVRQYITEKDDREGPVYAEGLAGVIVMGTGWQPEAALGFVKGLCAFLRKTAGEHHRSGVVDAMAFASNNKKFKPARTGFDWLSKDEAQVDKYVADPWCGFRFTVNAYYNMFKGIQISQNLDRIRSLPEGLDILFVSGADDPVGNSGEGVRKAYMIYSENSPCHVDINLYDGDRHEILNETDRRSVFADLAEWLDDSLKHSAEKAVRAEKKRQKEQLEQA